MPCGTSAPRKPTPVQSVADRHVDNRFQREPAPRASARLAAHGIIRRMSLATRCPVCSTVFRVVQDQLKVSEGWVRCGRCAKVFNAFEGLFDLERELGAAAPPSVTPSQRVLEDLAHRNRQPRQRGEWRGDEFPDTGASVRVGTTTSPPAHESTRSAQRSNSGFAPLPPPTTPPWSSSRASRLDEASSTAALPAWAASKPAPLSDASETPLRTATASNAPGSSSTTAAMGAAGAKPGLASTRPAPAWPSPAADTASAPSAGAGAAPAVTPTPAMVTRATQEFARAPGPAAVTPAPAPAPAGDIPLRAEPATVDPDAEASEGSYESMFRSTGELDPQTAHPSGLDIVLDPDEPRAGQGEGEAPDSRYLSFVQEAERAARWHRPGVRIALAVASIVLAGLLVLQLAIAERDQLAVRWPATKPLLGAACMALGCTIEPLRRIERLAVESSGLTRIGEAQVYRLAMVLHNRSEWPLQMPAVDLTLTDSGGGLVARRVLTPADLGSAASTIAAGQEVPLQVMLRSNDRPVTGYTIEIFYP